MTRQFTFIFTIIIGLFFSQSISEFSVYADEPEAAAETANPQEGAEPSLESTENEDALYVLSLLDIPDEETTAFYEERREQIKQAMRKYVGKTPTKEEYEILMAKVAEAYAKINEKIVASPEFDPSTPGNFMSYCDALVKKGAFEELETLLAQEQAKSQPNAQKVVALQLASVGASIVVAAQKKDGAMLRKIGDALVEKASKEPCVGNLNLYAYGVAQLERAAQKIADSTQRKALDRFLESGDAQLREFASSFGAERRKAELLGSELRVEGLFADGSEIDWSEYRGKVVLVDFWATWCGPCVAELPNVQAAYEKYREQGFEVVGYNLDSDLATLQKFQETRNLPWRNLSQKRSNDSGKYLDLVKFYAIGSIPSLILVDREGKVVATDARGGRLQQLLQEQFNDAK